MPFTRDLNDHYGITVRFDGQERSIYRACANVFRHDTQADVGNTHYGEGRTLPAAENRAFVAAREECPTNSPADWQPMKE